jgi:hypothetical protein
MPRVTLCHHPDDAEGMASMADRAHQALAPGGRIYVSHSMISSARVRPRHALREFASLERTPQVEARIVSMYEETWRFLFNQVLTDKLEATYLGSMTLAAGSHAFDRLGRIRCDYVLVRNRFFGTSTIDVHYLVERNEVDLRTPGGEQVAQLIRLIDQTYAERSAWPPYKDEARSVLRRTDRELSRYVYVSLCNQAPEVVERWLEHAEPIYRFLFGHERGTDAAVATTYLSDRHWSTGDFYVNFHQPGAILTLSSAYPEPDYTRHLRHFLPTVDTFAEEPSAVADDAVDRVAKGYDHLPEYPPLRYLGQPMLVHTGWVEEGMRNAQDRLLRVYDQPPPLQQVLAMWQSSRLQGSYYRLQMLDTLRLPVSRRYSRILRDDKILTPIADSVQQLQAGMINGVLIILTVLTVVLALLALFRR